LVGEQQIVVVGLQAHPGRRPVFCAVGLLASVNQYFRVKLTAISLVLHHEYAVDVSRSDIKALVAAYSAQKAAKPT